jgi:peptide/nickel transport system permease protein
VRRYLAGRLRDGLIVVFLVTTVTFVLIHLAPGDPFSAAFEDARLSPAMRAAWRASYGLNRPLPIQYLDYLRNVATGNFGVSIAYGEPVSRVLARTLPNTLVLMGTALALSFGLGVALGTVQAARHQSPLDRLLRAVALVCYSAPDFWFALVAMLVFALHWRLFPVTGTVDAVMHDTMSPVGRLVDRLYHLALPALTLTVLSTAGIARFQRSALLDVAGDDWIRTARGKGLSERRVLWHHALRNALLPTITLIGLAFPALLGGTVFIERVFAWPGMGRLTIDAIGARDYSVVLASVIVASVMVVLGSLLADLLTAAADPRMRVRR